MTVEELAERVKEVRAYRSLWMGGKESGPSVWQAKFKLADAVVEAFAREMTLKEELENDS